MKQKLTASAALLLAAAWAQEPTPRQQAEAAVAGLGQLLRELLSAELKKGADAAVLSCSDSAQLVTEEFSKDVGVDIRRVSLKYRNPKDRPDEWEEAKLREWEKLNATGRLPAMVEETITENGRRYYRYLRPIKVEGMCLACHGTGDQVPPEVREVLAEKYARDKATGYKAGDLRGAFSVTVALPK